MVVIMHTESPFEESFLEAFEVSSSTASSIHVGWIISSNILPFLEGFRVHYQKVASTYIQYGPKLNPAQSEFEIVNLVADTYYKVCLVIYRNDTNPFRECVDASTTNWQLPVSIGSSIGAILALSMIVLIVLLSRCQLPMKYRRKKAKGMSKYDTMSSNYHEDHYDFSETMTHGNDDDFTSEIDNEEDAFIDSSNNEHNRPKHGQTEKFSIANGLSRGHVHPHPHVHSQHHRNSLGRIQCPSHTSHHHNRPFRAYSIQADGQICFFNQPRSPLAKDPRKYSIGKEWNHVEELYPRTDECSLNSSNTKRIPLKEHSATKHDVLNQDSEQQNSEFNICSHLPQGFAYIDEVVPDATNTKTLSNRSQDMSLDSNNDIPDGLLIADLKYEDISAFGAVGGAKDTVVRHKSLGQFGKTKSVEMTSKNRMIAVPESVSFDEHAL